MHQFNPDVSFHLMLAGLSASLLYMYVCSPGSPKEKERKKERKRKKKTRSECHHTCTMSITNADIKASGDITAGPLCSQRRDSSAGSSLGKEDAFGGHETISRPSRRTGHGIDPSKHGATFETFGDGSFYTPIDNYEGKHRYDPTFKWEPHEERKLVRKVYIYPHVPAPSEAEIVRR